ncbi:MAG: tRNA 2-thiouridine(34) synthase MnmA [Pseudomonadales bacterium]|nr:tRNA 2-thiouridine(34) synthase MnmA [Pseudomonadales bacterium]MDG2078706.1 tRNA 2-thiouridine(34) synthase MnmA [Pseudomonadales bacterium]
MTTTQQNKVIVGLSGGVDSAVTALLLIEQGYKVEAMFMKNWNEDDGTEYCTARTDLEDALRICDRLNIELHTVNFASQYWDNVFDHFLIEYRAGRTPNPDVLCNREIKFKVFSDYANELGADFIATGHYARVVERDGQALLYKGNDGNKDQSYFLHAVSGQQFVKTLFPLGELTKTQVRQLAEKAGLHNYQKKDSTGICFIGERRFKDFLENYIPAQPGPILDEHGKPIGQHQGLMYHTIGQRQGLGIGGLDGAVDAPWYVAEKKMHNNTLIAVQGNQHPALFKSVLQTEAPHWINSAPTLPLTCSAKTRYRQPDQACSVKANHSGGLTVEFAVPQRAITPGQYVVFYEDQHCLGGAVIQ